jgi:hypothetical protein
MVLFDGYRPRIAGHYFVDLGGFHLVYAIFPFPVSTARIIGEFWKKFLEILAETAKITGAAWHTALIGEAGKRSPHL